MRSDTTIARALATVFLAGRLDVDELVLRGGSALGKRWRWLRPLAGRVCDAFQGRSPSRFEVARFILADKGFSRARQRHDLAVVTVLRPPPAMRPIAAAEDWRLPTICSVGALAEWLSLTIGELEWFADLRTLEYRQSCGKLRHYHYRVMAKRFGQVRLIEAPKPRLKQIQRCILSHILNHIPLHDAAHGFRRGRSIKTFATPHTGQPVVLRVDLQDFFPSIRGARIERCFARPDIPNLRPTCLQACAPTRPRSTFGMTSRSATLAPSCAMLGIATHSRIFRRERLLHPRSRIWPLTGWTVG